MIGFIVYKKNNAGEYRFLEVRDDFGQLVWRIEPKAATVFNSKDGANRFMLKRSGLPTWALREIYISETEISQHKFYKDIDVASMYPRIDIKTTLNPTYDRQMWMYRELMMQAERNKIMNQKKLPGIKKVIFNDPATIVMWNDGTKTIVKYDEKTKSGKKKKAFDPEKGLAMAIAKKALGNEGNYYETFKKWLPKEDK